MKKKTVWRFALALALMVSAIGASTAAFAAAPDTAEPTTAIATENEDAIWKQIEVVEGKRDAIFQRNTALWEKLDEIYNALPEDYDFTNFDEAAFIRSTRDEKSRTFSSNSKRSHILRTSSRSRRLILSSIVSLAVSLKCTRTI